MPTDLTPDQVRAEVLRQLEASRMQCSVKRFLEEHPKDRAAWEALIADVDMPGSKLGPILGIKVSAVSRHRTGGCRCKVH